MLWIILAIVSYFFSALAQIIDKVLLRARLPSPATYAFYTGISSALVVVILPFGGAMLPFSILILALVSGLMFMPAVFLLYVSLKRCDVSRIVPIVGGAIPIFLLLISFVWFGKRANTEQLFAIILFIFGGLILAIESEHNNKTDSFVSHILGVKGKRLKICNYDTGKGIAAAVGAAFFFAITYFLSMLTYESPANFIPEFFWIRMGSAISAICMLFIPVFRKSIFSHTAKISRFSVWVMSVNKIIGATGFFLLNVSFSLAITQGNVIIINAMKGIEHLFIFIFSLLLTLFIPSILKEDFDYHTIILKLTGIALIGLGFVYIL